MASSCNFKARRFHKLKSYLGSVCYRMRDSGLELGRDSQGDISSGGNSVAHSERV